MKIIRHWLSILYSTTLVVRIGLILGLITFSITGDPMFLVFLIIIAIGFVLTGFSYFLESKNP
ncbi:MAG: hypothetical protein OES09_09065 [Gammaproteobacteria bacterium]|nr:hypothetical protein [Gammaproteobacteria bacterium]